MSDLRTGLVEAMARGLVAHAADRDLLVLLSGNVAHRLAEGALDYGLDFLADNGDSWNEAALAIATGDSPGYSLVDNFIQVLSDSRDTGEKP